MLAGGGVMVRGTEGGQRGEDGLITTGGSMVWDSCGLVPTLRILLTKLWAVVIEGERAR